MKILVGILYSGEPQYNRCLAAIEAQTLKDWEIFEIRNLPNREAHQQLFNTFSTREQDFDLFIKIDADMELIHSNFFKELSDYFRQHTDIEHLSLKVDDFFTGRLIWGLNTFRSTVQFTENDEVYTDKALQIDTSRKAQLKRHPTLVPAAFHSYSPTTYQAFYFGCHKAIKVMHRQSHAHMRNIHRLLSTSVKKWDHRHLIAYAGAAMAFEKSFDPECLDHNNGKLKSLFEDLEANNPGFWAINLFRHIRIVRQARKQFLDGSDRNI